MRIRPTRVVIAVWGVLAAFLILHCSTNVGERWIWKLHTLEQRDSDYETTPKLPDGYMLPNNGAKQDVNIFDQIAAEEVKTKEIRVEALPTYTITHEIELAVVCSLALLMLNWRTPRVVAARNTTLHWWPSLIGIFFILPLIYVPCTLTYGIKHNLTRSEYLWLWDVDDWKIRITPIVLEELVLSAIVVVVLQQRKVLLSRSSAEQGRKE